MKSSSALAQASVTQMGVFARARLAPGLHGKVLASFSNAIYLLTDDAELFWIVTEDVSMHRRALKISSPLSRPKPGSPFHVEDHRVVIDPGYAYDLEHSRLWREPQVGRRDTIVITEMMPRVENLFSILDMSQVRGFGCFIPDILRLSRNEPIHPETGPADPILIFARPCVMNLARACLEHQPSRILQSANALIGLGTGLTPSGDDFLGGSLFCMNALQDSYSELNFLDPIPLERYGARTHPISFTILQDLANGHAIAPLHKLVNGILAGTSSESVQESILQLMQVGHSTGWDLLAGLLTGFLTAHPLPI